MDIEKFRHDLEVVSDLMSGSDASHAKPDTANWQRAFIVMVLVIAGEWTTSRQLSRYVDAVRFAAGDEPADLMAHVFNKTRTKFMQDFMG